MNPPIQSEHRPMRWPGSFNAAEALPGMDGDRFGLMYGRSAGMREVYSLIDKVAPTDATVFVVGESGCGKELVAQSIHQMSQRAAQTFMPVNCGAIPRNLIEAELFGFEKGAFTGASRVHKGLFERAHGGTLFLDEITEMAPEMQVRLLRVLECGMFTRVGGHEEIPVDVRIVAATNRDPMQAVTDGHLREDLMYRLAVFPITLPPLRARGDDILLLARQFIAEFNADAETSKVLSDEATAELCRRGWPGNVRELKNCLQRAFILADDVVLPEHLAPLDGLENDRGPVEGLHFAIGTPLAEMERQTIFATLDHCGGNKKRTAELLGVSLKTLYNRLTEYAAEDPMSMGGGHA